jgi:acyl dehydratase
VLLSMRGATQDVLSPEEARRGVHALQDSTFHRPMRPGDRLVCEGQLVSVRAARAGVLTVIRLITRDRESAEPVTTSWTTSIYRDVALAGAAASLAEPDPLDPDDLQTPGADAEAVAIPIPKVMPHVYSECADIWNPIHTERAVAMAAGLPDIILHGTATWALAGLTLLRRYGRDDVGALRRITGRFAGMVMPGETIEVRHERARSGAIRFDVRTLSGLTAISQGVAWLG